MRKIYCFIILSTLVTGCGEFKEEADQQFGDQHFKTAIALIELHKVRNGKYPDNLNQLKFLGGWDMGAINSVKYEKVGKGYTLEVVRGWVGKPELEYPVEFWKGLGIIRFNKSSKSTPKDGAI